VADQQGTVWTNRNSWPFNQVQPFDSNGNVVFDRSPDFPAVTLTMDEYNEWLGQYFRFWAMIDPQCPPSIYANPGKGVEPANAEVPLTTTTNPDGSTSSAFGKVAGVVFNCPQKTA
jgi:hypothetical protein